MTSEQNSTIDKTAAGEGYGLMLPLVVLALGHVLSNLMRTMPAVTVDVMAADLGCTPQTLVALTAVYHFAFALCQIPVGVALDRFSVRNVSLTLFAGTIIGACVAALSRTPASFFISQLLLGMATSGMLMSPMALAARRLAPVKFAMWSGMILALGNAGMLLSASPLAFLVENWGWRSGYWVSATISVVVAALVLLCVPNDKPLQSRIPALLQEMKTVLLLGASPTLRGIIMLSMVSLAVILVLRGVWAGPWLMDVKGLSRIEAGNVLTIYTITLVAGPLLAGVLDQKFGHRRQLILVTQLVAAALLVVMAGGGAGGFVSEAFGVAVVPARFDTMLLVMIGLLTCVQSLIYAMARQAVSVENTGKALSATNLALFLGTALMQSVTGPIATAWGLAAVLVSMGFFLVVGTVGFYIQTRTPRHGK